MSELSPKGGSEGYGACSDDCPALPACWTPEKPLRRKNRKIFLFPLERVDKCSGFLYKIVVCASQRAGWERFSPAAPL